METSPTPSVSLPESVAREIRAALGRLGINQAELARRLGVSDMWVSMRVRPNGARPIDLYELEQIARAIGVPPGSLLPAPERAA